MRANTFRPNPNVGATQMVSTGSGNVQSMTLNQRTEAVFITVEVTAVYLTFGGDVPSSSLGLLITTGMVHFLPLGQGAKLNFVSSGAGAGKVNVVELI